MFDISLRSFKDRLFAPLAPLIPRAITPGHLTLIAFVLGVLTCLSAARPQNVHMAVYFWLANRLFDCLDGATARYRNTASELGGLLDLMSDFVVYSAIPIAVGCGQAPRQGPEAALRMAWSIAFVEATFHVNNFLLFYCAAIAAQKGEEELTSVTMKPALIEGFESGLIFSAMFIWPQHVEFMCWATGGLVLVGTAQRFWYAIEVLSTLAERTAREKKV